MRTVAAVSLLVALAVAGGARLGWEVAERWPIQSVERFLGLPEKGWDAVGSGPVAGHEAGAIRIGSELFVFGGFSGSPLTARTDAFVFDIDTRSWRDLPDLPEAFTHAQPAEIDGRLWFAGGRLDTSRGPVSANVWSFDTETQEWRREPSLPEPRFGGLLLAVSDTLHFIGGYDDDTDTARDTHWILPPRGEAWLDGPPLPAPRGHHSGVTLGRALWVIGGTDSHLARTRDLTDVFVYDLDSGSWRPGPRLPFGISHAEAMTFAEQGRIFVVGGRALGRFRMGASTILVLHPDRGRWIQTGILPGVLFGGVATAYRDTLFAGLGAGRGPWDYDTRLNARPLRDAWFSVDAMPVPLGEVAAGIIDGHLYLLGQGSTRTLDYDLSAGRWEPEGERARRPLGGHHHAAEVVDGRLFLLGGLGGSHNNVAGAVQVYDPSLDEWSFGPPMPYRGGSVASATIGGKVYVAGGIVGDTTTRQAAVLDPATMTWATLPDMPRARNHTAAGTDGRRFYVFGGRGPGSGDANVVANGFADVQVFDPETGRWEASGDAGAPLPPLPQARGGMGKAAFLDGEFWVIGGETESGPGASRSGTYARVDIFDPVARTWRRGPDLTIPRHGIFPVTYEGRIVVAGGGSSSGYGTSDVVEVIWPR